MALKVRIYNVGFGDASLLSWKENGDEKHIMIDFGNASKVKNEPYYGDIIKDIKKITNSKIDLLVCTHLHLDHYEGFSSKKSEFKNFEIKKLWMPYIEKKDEQELENIEDFMHNMLKVPTLKTRMKKRGYMISTDELEMDPVTKNKKWEEIKKLVKPDDLHYVHRTTENICELHPPFSKMSIEVLGPERHTGFYTKSAQKWIKNFASFFSKTYGQDTFLKKGPVPKRFWKSFDFKKLEPRYLSQFIETNGDVYEFADKIRNNTSIVLRLVYRDGNKMVPLLFSGDAQFESWQKIVEAHKRNEINMNSQFLKVSHHGSHNGTSNIIAKNIFSGPKSKNTSIISTLSGVYGTKNPVPHEKVQKTLKKYSKLMTTEDMGKGTPIIISY